MKKHPTHPDLWVTEDGRVFQELGTSPGFGGYMVCSMRGNRDGIRRHTLVCETYHGPRPKGNVVRHLDGDCTNDKPNNLAWGTQAQNCQDTVAHGTSTKGERNPFAKLTEAHVAEIRSRWASGESPTFLAEEFGVSQANVQDIVRGRTWKHLPITKR